MKHTAQLGEYLKSVRTDRGLSMQQAANKAGISKGTFSKLENGKVDPCYSTLLNVGLALGITVSVGKLSV